MGGSDTRSTPSPPLQTGIDLEEQFKDPIVPPDEKIPESDPATYTILGDSRSLDELSFSKSDSCLVLKEAQAEKGNGATPLSLQSNQKSSRSDSQDQDHRYREFANILFKLHKKEQSTLADQNLQLEDRLLKLLAVLKKKEANSNSPNLVISELENERGRLKERIKMLEQWKDKVTGQILSHLSKDFNPGISLSQILEWLQKEREASSSQDPMYDPYGLAMVIIAHHHEPQSEIEPLILSQRERDTLCAILEASDPNLLKHQFPDFSVALEVHDESVRNRLDQWNQLAQDPEALVHSIPELISSLFSEQDSLLGDYKKLHAYAQEIQERDAATNSEKEEYGSLERDLEALKQMNETLQEEKGRIGSELSREQGKAAEQQDLISKLEGQHQMAQSGMEKKIQELNKSLEEQNRRLQEYKSKEKDWKNEMELLDQEIKQLEQERGAGAERNDAIDSLEKELKELQLRLDYLKNSFVQFAKHKEKQDSLLPVIATLLQVPLEDFSPLAAANANQEHAGILSSMFGSNSTTIQPNGGSSGGFWPLW